MRWVVVGLICLGIMRRGACGGALARDLTLRREGG